MPKTQVESLVDEMLKHISGIPSLVPGVRKQIEGLVGDLLKAGFQINAPGMNTFQNEFVTRQREKISPSAFDHTSFFCPHCGKHKPAYGFNGANGAVKGFGNVAYVTIFCAEETCRAILQVIILAMTPEGKVQ
jgi:hypothetical protein